MFDLEQEIRHWRKTISSRLPFQSDAVAELESHLRDAVIKCQQDGLTPQDAWKAALNQLGDSDVIAQEYAKLPRHSVRRWLPTQIVVGAYVALALFAAYGCSRRFLNTHDALLVIHVWTVTMGYAAVFAVGAIAVWAILSRALRGWSTTEADVLLRTTRYFTTAGIVLVGAAVILGGLWLQKTSGSIWANDPREIGGVTMLAWNALVILLLVRMRDERLEMRLGLAGNAVVAACWFVPLILSKVTSHGFDGISLALTASLCGFVLLIAFFGALTFLQPGCLRLRSSQ